MHQALEALPKPTWIACATGNRASGALLIHEGIKRGWTAAQALAYAAEHGLKPADPVRSWVTATLDPISPKVLATPTRSGAVVFRQLFDGVSSEGGVCCGVVSGLGHGFVHVHGFVSQERC